MLPLHTTVKSVAFGFSFLLIFTSCFNDSKKHDEIVKALNESIENSNKWLEISTNDILTSLRNKIEEPVSSERAKVWYPRAEKIQQLSKELFNYIENLKQRIKDTSINSLELFERLKKYREQLFHVDSNIKKQFEKSIQIFTQSIDSSEEDHQKLFEGYFKNVSSESAIAMLNKLQSNIRFNEMRFITFCNEHVGIMEIVDYGVTYFTILNSNVFKPRDTVEITAGIIVFDKRYHSKVFVYDHEIDSEDDGFGHYKLRASSKAGKYYVPVKIKYIDQNGKEQTVQKEMEYTVANMQQQ